MQKLACFIGIFYLLLTGTANAENTYKETIIRCEKGIVSLGDAQAILAVKCGQPLYQAIQSYQSVQWTYVTDGMVRVVTIKNGIVKNIITAGRAN